MTEEIAIKYNQKQSTKMLIFGIVCLLLYFASQLYGNSNFLLTLIMGITLIVMFFYKKQVYYLRTENGILKKDLGAKIPINEIIETSRFAGDYIFKSKDKTITIDKNAVDKSSLDQLEKFINQIRGVS